MADASAHCPAGTARAVSGSACAHASLPAMSVVRHCACRSKKCSAHSCGELTACMSWMTWSMVASRQWVSNVRRLSKQHLCHLGAVTRQRLQLPPISQRAQPVWTREISACWRPLESSTIPSGSTIGEPRTLTDIHAVAAARQPVAETQKRHRSVSHAPAPHTRLASHTAALLCMRWAIDGRPPRTHCNASMTSPGGCSALRPRAVGALRRAPNPHGSGIANF